MKYLSFLILLFSPLFATAQVITAMEYYVDNDPGIGLATNVPITGGASINENFVVPGAALSVGFHTITIRTQDAANAWSVQETRVFYVSAFDLTTQADIVAMEYYLDSDPGYGAGTSIAIGASPTIDVNTTITGIPSGFHTLHVRALDVDGTWGETESRPFFVDAFGNGQIADIEYFIDNDPGYGNGSNIPVLPAMDTIDREVTVVTNTLPVGNYVVGMRIRDTNGNYGMTDYLNLAVCATASADFSSDVVCVGGATTFTDASLNVIGGDVYSWDFDGDAVEDANTAGNQTFTYPTSGTYDATLTIDRAGCISTFISQVQVEALPIASAGIDQSLCVTNTTLAANAPAANETGAWSVFSGTATITTPTSETSTITSIGTNSVELIWTLTNTLGGCSDSDTVLISANLPITATSQTATVDIGQTINVDVQSSATINPSDVLTTTISTQPINGTANILTDGTIDYLPDLDAPSADSLTYRITNQCSNFDENLIRFTVANQPPAIDSTGFSATPNAVQLTFDLTQLISDPNNNLDFSTLRVVTQPVSGAVASIDVSGTLTIDYTGITYSGNDQLEIEICDLVGVCAVQLIVIPNVEVGGENPPLRVFNAVSPNGDGYHDFLEIENIEFYPNNTVIILNRWGDEVAKFQGYDNQSIVFSDATLPSGTYYYHVLPGVDQVKSVTGHFILKVEN